MVKNIKICKGPACLAKGANITIQKLLASTNLQFGQCNDKMCVDTCSCTGHCAKGANVRVDDLVVHKVNSNNIIDEINNPTNFSKPGKTLNLNIDELIEI